MLNPTFGGLECNFIALLPKTVQRNHDIFFKLPNHLKDFLSWNKKKKKRILENKENSEKVKNLAQLYIVSNKISIYMFMI